MEEQALSDSSITSSLLLQCAEELQAPTMQGQRLRLRSLVETELDTVLDLQDLAAREMGDLYFPHDRSRIYGALRSNMCFGCYIQNELVGFRLVEFPTTSESTFLQEIKMGHVDPAKTAQLIGLFVLPAFRGRRLGRILTIEALKKLRQACAVDVFTTVGPRNLANLRNLLRLGFKIRTFAHTFGGLERFILDYSLSAENHQSQTKLDLEWIRHSDMELQIRRLNSGSLGVDIERRESDFFLAYTPAFA